MGGFNMNHLGTVMLETERLILRKFTKEDYAAAFHNWTSDDKVTKFLRWPTHTSMAITQSIVDEWIASYVSPNFYQWAIVLKSINEPVGSISVVEQNEVVNSVHIGYCIGSKWWHQGITSEAFSGIISFLFEQVKVNRIESQHDPNNPNSGRVMQKCGLTYEGTYRQADISNQGIVDASMYSLLASEYFDRK